MKHSFAALIAALCFCAGPSGADTVHLVELPGPIVHADVAPWVSLTDPLASHLTSSYAAPAIRARAPRPVQGRQPVLQLLPLIEMAANATPTWDGFVRSRARASWPNVQPDALSARGIVVMAGLFAFALLAVSVQASQRVTVPES